MTTKELFKFIKERHSVFLKKEAGKPKPWTKDEILQQYKFCNVHREDDWVSRWIAENWREPAQNDPNIWFAMVIARLVNWPDSLRVIMSAVISPAGKRYGATIKWDVNQFLNAMQARRDAGEKMYTGAYMIHADRHFDYTFQYQAVEIFTPMWEARKTFPAKARTLREVFEWLKQFECMGDFMAAQVIADIKYCPAFDETRMSDWWTFAAPGPGSRRGLGRVIWNDKDYKWKEPEWQYALSVLQRDIDIMVTVAGMPRLHAQDLQNCLCEFDKYLRVKNGEGRPRSLYAGVK